MRSPSATISRVAPSGIGMVAFAAAPASGGVACRRFGGFLDDIAGWGCGIGTCHDFRAVGAGSAAIDDAVDASADVVGDVQRTVGSHSQAAGTVHGFGGRLIRACEAIGEDFALAGGAIARERLKYYIVAALRIRGSVPGTMEGDEDTASVAGGKLFLIVQRHRI